MPNILDSAVKQINAKIHSKSKAYAIATSALTKAGVLKPGTTQLTPKGKKRNAMTKAQRAASRKS